MANSSHVIDVSEANFEQEVISRSHDQPVVVDFWAPWCGPCRSLGPILERLANAANGTFTLAKLNTDENPDLAMRYNIRGIPAVKAFRDGEVVSEFVGAQPEPNVRRFLEELGGNATSGAAAEAARLLSEHRWMEAEAALAEMAANGNADDLGMARALLGLGKGAEAEAALGDIDDASSLVAAETLRPLAELMVQALEPPAANEGEQDLLLRQAGELAAAGEYAGAMDALLAVMRRDKRYRNDTPRRVMLALFALLGDQDQLTRDYRNRLASALF